MSAGTAVSSSYENLQANRYSPEEDPLLLISSDRRDGHFREDRGSYHTQKPVKHELAAQEGTGTEAQSETDPTYSYDDIPVSSHHLRLLKVEPSTNDDDEEIHLTLRVARLGDMKERYDAVSYMWGDRTPLHLVYINGRQLWIRPNLWYCLQHIRKHHFQVRELWIDAICINQNDTIEKNHQVSHMGDVYRHACRVLVWLGKASQSPVINLPDGKRPKRLDGVYASADCKEMWDTYDDNFQPVYQRAQLRTTLDDPYWQRVWIVQELALAKEALIISGGLLITFMCLEDLFNMDDGIVALEERSDRLFGDEDIWEGNKKNFQRVLEICCNYSTPELDPLQLHFLLQYCHRFTCEDPRDRVYGILSLTHALKEVQVEYDCEVEELTMRILQCLLLRVREGHTHKLDTQIVGFLMKAMNVTPASFTLFLHKKGLFNYRLDKEFSLNFSGYILYPYMQDQKSSTEDRTYHIFEFHDFQDVYVWYDKWKRIALTDPPDPSFHNDTGVILLRSFGMTDLLVSRSIDGKISLRYFTHEFEVPVNSGRQSTRKTKAMDNDIMMLFQNRLNDMYENWSKFCAAVTSETKIRISCTALELIRFVYWPGWPQFKTRHYHISSPAESET